MTRNQIAATVLYARLFTNQSMSSVERDSKGSEESICFFKKFFVALALMQLKPEPYHVEKAIKTPTYVENALR